MTNRDLVSSSISSFISLRGRWWRAAALLSLHWPSCVRRSVNTLSDSVMGCLCVTFHHSSSPSSRGRCLESSQGCRPVWAALSSSPCICRSGTPWCGAPCWLLFYPRSSPAERPAGSHVPGPRGGGQLLWRLRVRQTHPGVHTKPLAVIYSSWGKSASTSPQWAPPLWMTGGTGGGLERGDGDKKR